MEPSNELESIFEVYEKRLDEQGQQLREQVRGLFEQWARDVLIRFYTDREKGLSTFSAGLQGIGTHFPDLSFEKRGRVKFNAINDFTLEGDAIIERMAEGALRVLDLIGTDPEIKTSIIVESLQAGKSYWEDRLKQPDLTPDEILAGRRRLTHFSQRLENLTGQPDQPQQL